MVITNVDILSKVVNPDLPIHVSSVLLFNNGKEKEVNRDCIPFRSLRDHISGQNPVLYAMDDDILPFPAVTGNSKLENPFASYKRKSFVYVNRDAVEFSDGTLSYKLIYREEK